MSTPYGSDQYDREILERIEGLLEDILDAIKNQVSLTAPPSAPTQAPQGGSVCNRQRITADQWIAHSRREGMRVYESIHEVDRDA